MNYFFLCCIQTGISNHHGKSHKSSSAHNILFGWQFYLRSAQSHALSTISSALVKWTKTEAMDSQVLGRFHFVIDCREMLQAADINPSYLSLSVQTSSVSWSRSQYQCWQCQTMLVSSEHYGCWFLLPLVPPSLAESSGYTEPGPAPSHHWTCGYWGKKTGEVDITRW